MKSYIFNCLLFYFVIIYTANCNEVIGDYDDNNNILYLKNKIQFIIFDDFHIGPDGKSILNILNIENEIPKSNIYYLSDNIPSKYQEDSLLLPILIRLIKNTDNYFDWFFILNSNTRFEPFLLNRLLYKLNHEQINYKKLENTNNFIGAQVNDNTPSIVHHYNLNKNFKYPFHHSGYAIRKETIEALRILINSSNIHNSYKSKIYTDVHFELAKLINDELNIKLKDIPEFCITLSDTNSNYHTKNSIIPKKCATWSISNRISYHCVSHSLPTTTLLDPELIINPQEVVIAVKTTKKYHHNRINQINQLWLDEKFLNYNSINKSHYCHNYLTKFNKLFQKHSNKSINIEILSDSNDNINNLKITDLKTGNQIKGHCLKFYSIIHSLFNKYIVNNSSKTNIKYFIFVDDDTLIIPFSLLNLLTYLNHHFKDNSTGLYLGLRYSLGSIIDNWTIDYITGGAGIIINSNSLIKLVNCKECFCNKPDEPDDMALGRWFKYLNIKATNYDGFHQAEPDHYHSFYNYYSPIISYHKIDSNIDRTINHYDSKLFGLLYPHMNYHDNFEENKYKYGHQDEL
ncbi:beta-1,3-glucosyltransferase isoform X1 [Cryptosporidium felis]|nr:beta-1,3-glucosyltransferase isoform X1 [Cryptosporidium felis]